MLNSKNTEFMTSRDILSATLSQISIQNIGAEDTVTGIYLFVLGEGAGNACLTPLIESEGAPFGALWSPKVTMATNETRNIGANYLYNMIMMFLYQAHIDGHGALGTPGSFNGGNTYCVWLGVTNQTVGTGTLTSTNGALENANQLVQYIEGDLPISFTNIICNDSTRQCTTTDIIQPQPFPHQRP
ncbi:MAG: hypothetical protein GW760_00855 [Legionella sp.]|jgi:hypothetical protein|nr:hypothetical protein [Legionella sp.]